MRRHPVAFGYLVLWFAAAVAAARGLFLVNEVHRLLLVPVILGIDLLLLVYALITAGAWQTFCRRLQGDALVEQRHAEQLESEQKQEQEEAAVAADKEEPRTYFRNFCAANRGFLEDDFPPELLASFLRLEASTDLDAPTIWRNVREQITRLQPVVTENKKKNRKKEQQKKAREERIRQLQKEQEKWRRRLEQLGQPGIDPDVVADEKRELHRAINELQEEIDMLSTFTPEE